MAEASPAYSFSEFVQPMSNCQHVVSLRNNVSASASLSFVRTLTLLDVPFQYLLHLPNDTPENYARRHLQHCLIRHAFPALNHRGYYAFESAIAVSGYPLRTVLVRRNRKTDLVFLYAERLDGKYPRFTSPNPYLACAHPLNFAYVFIEPEGGKLVLLHQSFHELTYEYITNTLKKKRCNTNELRLRYGPSYLGREAYSWEEVKFIVAEKPFYRSYVVRDGADIQLAYLISRHLNFTFDMEKDYHGGECAVAAITHYTLATSEGPGFGADDSIRMVQWRFYKILYATAVEEILPTRLRTFAAPATSTVWLLLGAVIALTALLTKAFICPAADSFGSLLTVTAPYIGHIVSCSAMEGKFRFLFASWALIAVFLGALYTSIIQSFTVVPTVRPGEFSLEDLLKNNYTCGPVYLPYYRYIERTLRVTWSKNFSNAAKKEKLLMKVIKPGSGDWRLNVTYGVEYFKKARPMQLLTSASTSDVYAKMYAKLSERNLNICEDEFVSHGLFISFHFTPSCDVLERKFQGMWDAGFVTFWQRIRSRASNKQLEQYTLAKAQREGLVREETIVEGTLLESLIREGFFVFLYGICTAIFAALLEYFLSYASCSFYCE